MSDSDDDMPPPLEDMSEQIQISKKKKQEAMGYMFGGANKSEDHVEEVRLAPKKKPEAAAGPGASAAKTN